MALRLGFVQLVPGVSDPMGRSILYVDPSVQDRRLYSRENMCRAVWYTIFAALESETAQRHGIIVLSNNSRATFGQSDTRLSRMVINALQGAIPVRLSAFHICHPPSYVAGTFAIAKLFMSARTRKRFLIQNGSAEEVLRSLGEYGMSTSVIPAPLAGGVKLDHERWLHNRRLMGH